MSAIFTDVQQQEIRLGVTAFLDKWYIYSESDSFAKHALKCCYKKEILPKSERIRPIVNISKKECLSKKEVSKESKVTKDCFKALLKSGESVDNALTKMQEMGVDISSLSGYVKKYQAQKSFADEMQSIMIQEEMTPVDVYTKAQIDRRLFSKICGREPYSPSKDTCLSIILALGADMEMAEKLLSLAGYSLSNHSERDLIIKYCLVNKHTSVVKVNEILDMFNCKILRA